MSRLIFRLNYGLDPRRWDGILLLQEPLFLQNILDYGERIFAHDVFALSGTREGIRPSVTFNIANKPSENKCCPVVSA
jgi:hypothetical protein